MARKESIEFLLRLFEGPRAVRVVLPELGISIQRVQRLQVFGFKMAQQKALGIQDEHEQRRVVCEA